MRQIKIAINNVGLNANKWPLNHYAYRNILSQLPKDIKLVMIEHDPTRIGTYYFYLEHDDFKDVGGQINIPEVVIEFSQDLNSIVTSKVKDLDKHLESKTNTNRWNTVTLPTGSSLTDLENEVKKQEIKEMIKEAEEETEETEADKLKKFFFKEHHPKCTCGQKTIKDALHADNCPSRFKEVKQ